MVQQQATVVFKTGGRTTFEVVMPSEAFEAFAASMQAEGWKDRAAALFDAAARAGLVEVWDGAGATLRSHRKEVPVSEGRRELMLDGLAEGWLPIRIA